MQGSYSFTPGVALEGQKVDLGDDYVVSNPAAGAVNFGLGVISSSQRTAGARKPARNKAVITFSADFVASNLINGSINGTAIAQVTYATSNANTYNLVKTAIETVLTALGLTGTVTVDATAHTVTILLTGSEQTSLLLASWAVTAGASQATNTIAYSTDGFFRGVALHQHRQVRADGTFGYADTDPVAVMRRGRVWVLVTEAVSEGDTAYCVLATSGSEGKFCKTSTGNLATGGTFAAAAAQNALAPLDINLP